MFVGGHGDWSGAADGGTVRVTTLRTGEIQTDGGIAPGTPDLISGGVFVISGADVEKVRNDGPVTTYGSNEIVLEALLHPRRRVEAARLPVGDAAALAKLLFHDG